MSGCGYGPAYGEFNRVFPPVGTRRTPYYETAYDIAVRNGYKGTEKEWLESLQGAPGKSGDDMMGTSAMDMTGWENGTFTKTLEDGTEVIYTVTFNENNYPVLIEDNFGHQMTLTWPEL